MVMNGLQKGLVGIVLSGIAFISGCSALGFKIGEYVPVDLSRSRYASDIEKKADELAESDYTEDKQNVIKAYGSIGLLEKMDENIKDLIKKNLDAGMSYADVGDKYHRMYEKDKK